MSKRRRHWVRNLFLLSLALVAIGFAAAAFAVARTTVPSPSDVATSQATVVYYADGVTELGRLGESTRRSIPLNDVPLQVQRAVLAAEDRSFYEHGGISPVGIARAVWNNVTGGSTQGGSTITQQYAKNAFLSQERSWQRKIREALLAFKLETVVSKDQILEDYLNTIYFGRGAYGIEAASLAYFGKPASELTVAEGAVLAAIIKSPNGLAPEEDLPGLQGRWTYVLDGMVQQGWLSAEERAAQAFPRIKKLKAANRLGGQTGFLLNAVTDQLIALGFDETEIERGGLRITATFDRAAQRAAVKAVRAEGPSSGTEGLRIGLAAVRPGTGEVIALYGGPDFVEDQIDNATTPFAQAGSTFKPFALAAALEQGIMLSSYWNGDSPATIKGYTLTNYGDKSYGMVTLLDATERSINTAYVEVEDQTGVQQVADAALRAGIPPSTPGLNLNNLDLTFVLGTASPSGLDMASAYATFAARGRSAAPTTVLRVTTASGSVLYEYQATSEAAFDSGIADTVTYALNKAVNVGTGVAARALGRPAAGKTGTTDDNKSAWFVGYTPQLATAVLMAKEDADGKPVSMAGTGGLRTVTGGSFPAAIWTAFMTAALENEPVMDFPRPPPGSARMLDCPSALGVDTVVPSGCPTPSIAEFEPAPSDFAPSLEPVAPSVGPSPSVPSNEFAPSSPAVGPSPDGAPTQEARPQ